MREELSTDAGARWPESGLSGPIFSGPDDCADLVDYSQPIEIKTVNPFLSEHFDFRGALRKGAEIENHLGKVAG
jgi:hypothetical protein